MEKNSELKCCLGSGIFTAAVKRGVAPHIHVNKEFWQQFQNYAPPSLRVIRTKFARIARIARTIIGERAKRARHSQVCSIENRILSYILEKWFPLWGERTHSLKLFCMYDKRFEI